MPDEKWYKKSYRRNLIDMHIEDWDEDFFSKLNSRQYAGLLKRSKVQTAMVYSNSHVGLCNWPTQNGRMHSGLKGKDFLGEMIKLLHDDGISVIVYFSLIYDNWAFEHDPSWRIVNRYGCNSREKSEQAGSRYGVCCPNNKGYREYAVNQTKELCQKYKYEGMFFDMTFWPTVCYCPSCVERLMNETGMDIPTVIDWKDERWLSFQKKREEWMTEFVNLITTTVKELKPETTVEYNFATVSLPWTFGVSEGMTKACDYVGGDFYGGILQQSFICKLYKSLTANEPFEYMTSRCDPNLTFHTTTKSKEYLEQHVYVTLAHNGAFLFIDAIDPAGTIQPRLYDTMGDIFSKSMQYEPYLGGGMCSDVAIYYSVTSKMCFEANGKDVKDGVSDSRQPHLGAALGALETLKRSHIPVSVIGKSNLKELSDYKVLILPDVHFMDDEEATAIREFVEKGGSIYASGHTYHKFFDEVFGIEPQGETKEDFTYMTPTEAGKFLMPGIDAVAPMTVNGKQFIVKALCKDEVMARVTLPYTDPSDNTKFASIHSNPPGISTQHPALIYRGFRKGRVIWVSSSVEAAQPEINRKAFLEIIRELGGRDFSFEANAPAAVEVVMFHQPKNKRYIVSLINEQELLPPVPVHDVTVSVRLDGKKVVNAKLLPDGSELTIEVKDGYAVVKVPNLDIFHMFMLSYE